ncbi:XRE family transcriptional regulator [Blautia producta]|uniref:helix-turn-helix transcriptional regulator n=1 Tax=Blautia producta TaxID=33035 RepID=UPI0004967109
MLMDSNKIRGRMAEMRLTQKDVACKEVWDCALPTVSQKLNGIRPISLDEANALAKLLNLTEKEYFEFFFGSKIA